MTSSDSVTNFDNLGNPKDLLGQRKADIASVPIEVLVELGLAMKEGANKYGAFNWRTSEVRASVYLGALWRHAFVQWWALREEIDRESGVHHLTKAISTLTVIRDAIIQGEFIDDRPMSSLDASAVESWNRQAAELRSKHETPSPSDRSDR